MTASALVLTAPRTFERREFELPDVGDDDGLLAIEACGLCGTDHEQYTGHIRSPHAFIPGHEVVGTLVAAGATARQRWGVHEGQRIAVEVFQRCGECDACRAGVYRRCAKHGMRTMVGFSPAVGAKGLRGGYSTHLYLGPDSMVIPVPDSLDPAVATVFNPLGAGIRWAVELPGTKHGDVVAVLGPGIRGLCASAAAKHAGASFVMITGMGPRDADRLALAARFGADLAVDVAVDDPSRALKQATGGLADVVVDVTAKAPAAFAQAVSLAKPGGTVVVAGTRGSAETPGFNPDHVVYKELRLLGALGVDVTAYRAAFEMLTSHEFPFAELPRRLAGFDELEPLIQSMAGERPGVAPVHGVFVPRPNQTGEASA